jgi:hypothetical protein
LQAAFTGAELAEELEPIGLVAWLDVMGLLGLAANADAFRMKAPVSRVAHTAALIVGFAIMVILLGF